MLGLPDLVIEAMKLLGYAVRDGIFAWIRWHWKEPCDAWVYHAAMFALTPRRQKSTRRYHTNVGRRCLARCVAKRIREGKVPPKIDGNPARWLEQHHMVAKDRVVAECESALKTCRREDMASAFLFTAHGRPYRQATDAELVHRAVLRLRERSPAPRVVERDDTPIDEVPT